jgi:hypothetical protein
LDRGNYDSICALVNPQELTERLQALYGSELKTDEYERFSDRPTDVRIASQFAYLHRHATVERASPAEPEVLVLEEHTDEAATEPPAVPEPPSASASNRRSRGGARKKRRR